MKTVSNLRFLLLGCAFFIATFGQAVVQEEVSIGLEHVFVPKGFDSNDHVEVVITGVLPNTCYLRPHGEIKVVDHQIAIDMKATKISGEDVNCIMALVPYMASVPLGRLNEGVFNIFVNEGGLAEQNNKIFIDHPGSNSINNFSYANVTSIEQSDSHKLTIKGVHPSSCMTIKDVQVLTNDTNDTYSILPIVEQVAPICDRLMTPFTHQVNLPKPLHKEQLAHIRKIDGTALNFLITK